MPKRVFVFLNILLCTMLFITSFSGVAGAVATTGTSLTFTPNPSDLYDLEHAHYYTWGNTINLQDNEVITSATLSFTNLHNYRDPYDNDLWPKYESNDLWVHVLNSWFNAGTGVTSYNDSGYQYNIFNNNGIEVYHGHNLSATPQTFSVDFSTAALAYLNDSVKDDGFFLLGFDPDCHFYNDGISFTVTTGSSAVPVPAAFYLLGCGLIGLAGAKRKFGK